MVYQEFFTLPFQETVGVGASSYRVCLDNFEDMKNFFLSDESLKCYSNSQIDLANIANVFRINIAVFTYGLPDTEPRWTWTTPDMLVSQFSRNTNSNLPNLYLYHANNSHYDLLVFNDSALAVRGSVGTGGKSEVNFSVIRHWAQLYLRFWLGWV